MRGERPEGDIVTPYEQKKADRIERTRAAAAKLAAAGAARIAKGHAAFDRIPFGQPIHVGHHSEAADRNYRRKAHDAIGKGLELTAEAERLAARADRAETSTAVSSDDPDAPSKLADKLAKLEAEQAHDKAVNRIVGAEKRKGGAGWKESAIARLVSGGVCSATLAAGYLVGDFAGRFGVPDYRLTNRSAEIRRVKARIAQLEAAAAAPVREPETFGEVEAREDRETNRVLVVFPGKPSDGVREELRSVGFRWAPSVGAWQRQASADAWHWARVIAQKAAEAC